MQSIKAKGVGTNPKIFDNGAMIAQMGLNYYYLTQAGWSHAFASSNEAYDVASAIEAARKKLEKLKKVA